MEPRGSQGMAVLVHHYADPTDQQRSLNQKSLGMQGLGFRVYGLGFKVWGVLRFGSS